MMTFNKKLVLWRQFDCRCPICGRIVYAQTYAWFYEIIGGFLGDITNIVHQDCADDQDKILIGVMEAKDVTVALAPNMPDIKN